MPVRGIYSVTLEVPDLNEGIAFYTNAGLEAEQQGDVVRLKCKGQNREAIVLLGGRPRKRLHHLALRADGLDEIRGRVKAAGGELVSAPIGFENEGLWVS